jgi:hypothetical protein
MSMYKAAQIAEEIVVSLPISVQKEPEDEVVFYDNVPSADEVVEMHDPASAHQEPEITFKLPHFPGCDDDVVSLSDDAEEESDAKESKEKDKSKAEDQSKDLNWMKEYLNNIPKHKGETTGLERAKSYLNRGSNHLSKILQEDYDGKIDISKAEDARIEIENGIDRIEKELAKRKKKASKNGDLTKEASTHVGGIIVTVPILISRIARVCINGSISGGKDIEDLFNRQAKKWNLTEREKAEVVQLIQDMGFPVPRLDRGFMVDDKEKYDSTSTDNYELPANYNA